MKESTPARDVQELERQLSQIQRLYATLSQVNQLLVRVKEREELYRSMCEVVVRYGGFTLAWVGILDDETGDVRPFAAKGMDLDHWPFENINIRHGVLSDSLSAMAIRTGGVVTSEDIQTDGRMQKIHDRLNHFPFHSSASIPFRLRGKIIGMLNLVSDEEGLFKSEEELHLLQEMGADISFALDAMESE
ncbi:MAG: GAF domain-containing protein, partial [Acidobacteriota bacterium]